MTWQNVKLGDVCTVVRNGASIKQIDSALGIPITRIETIADCYLNLHKLGYADIFDDTYKDYYLQKNDILMSHINSWEHLGKTAKVGTLTNPIIHGMNLLLIRTISEVLNATYLNYYFKSNHFRASIDKIANQSVNQASFAVTKLKEIEIPLPPLDVQKKIADILDKADALRRKDAELIKKYDELAQSIFIDMFGDPVTNPKGWETKKFGDLGSLDRGKSKHRPRNDPKLLGGIYPLIQTGDVANADGIITKYNQTYSEFGLQQSKLWHTGTLCITIAANIAKTGILSFHACFPDSVVGFIPNESTNNHFIQSWMSFLQKILEETAPESAQKNINLEILRDLDVICPPKNKQRLFYDIMEVITHNKRNANNAIIKSEQLFQSLLQRAFNGELVH